MRTILKSSLLLIAFTLVFSFVTSCGESSDECSAFLINSQDPQIDINYTIRELDNVQFGESISNDFTQDGQIGYQDLLGYGDYVAQYNIFPSFGHLTTCDYTPVIGSPSFAASEICEENIEFMFNSSSIIFFNDVYGNRFKLTITTTILNNGLNLISFNIEN